MFTVTDSLRHVLIKDQHNAHLNVGLLAQLVEHYTGVVEVMGSNPVQAWIFMCQA